MGKNDNQLCVITIMFSIADDDEAMKYRKQIAEILSPIDGCRIDFRLTTARPPNERNT